MTILPVSTVTPQPAPVEGVRKDLEAVKQALSAGDLPGAQKSFATFMQEVQSERSQGGQQHVPFEVKQDLKAVKQALDSGDLGAAQQAFQSMLQDIQSHVQTRRMHQHQSGPPEPSPVQGGVDVIA